MGPDFSERFRQDFPSGDKLGEVSPGLMTDSNIPLPVTCVHPGQRQQGTGPIGGQSPGCGAASGCIPQWPEAQEQQGLHRGGRPGGGDRSCPRRPLRSPPAGPHPGPGWRCRERGASELHLELEGPGEGTSLVGERATSGVHPAFCALFTQLRCPLGARLPMEAQRGAGTCPRHRTGPAPGVHSPGCFFSSLHPALAPPENGIIIFVCPLKSGVHHPDI